MFPITAGLGALSLLSSLLQSTTASNSSSQTGTSQSLLGRDSGNGDQSQSAQSVVGSGGLMPPLDPGVLAALFSLQQQNGTNGSGQGSLFAKLDSNGDGTISQGEFEKALSADGVDTQSADALFGKLDTNGDGSVSQSELAAAGGRHRLPRVGGMMPAGLSPLLTMGSTSGAQTQTTTNTDGSTTTTITYSDGSTVSMTTPAAASSTSSSTSGDGSTGSAGSTGSGATSVSQNNLLEQLIKLQSQFLAQVNSGLSTLA